ncbi:MAG: NAD(P)/FAD-dependent oxidoreductase [Nanoarchaeota archaeon]|nr:NAD(P)/FAD-dependent oxidoreductase [Nanoarchaeota archaeon]
MYDLVIIGSGIAGITAGIYAARKRMNYVLICNNFGGQFMESGEILNYPGIMQTTGVDFAETIRKQAEFNEVNMVEGEEVKNIVKIDNDNYKITTGKLTYETRAIIIATGARPRMLNVPGEKEFKNKGVFYCAVCDGPLFLNKNVAVIGGGDSALDAADFLLNIASKIYIINNNKEFKAHEYLQERVKGHDKTEVILGAETKEIIGDKFVTGLKYIQGGNEQDVKQIDVDGIFIEIGRVPNTEFAKWLLEIDEHGHINIDEGCYTSMPGIFAAGDCASGHEYQYVIAAGQGCISLLKAARYLAKKKG